jgi:hypothetical protein
MKVVVLHCCDKFNVSAAFKAVAFAQCYVTNCCQDAADIDVVLALRWATWRPPKVKTHQLHQMLSMGVYPG